MTPSRIEEVISRFAVSPSLIKSFASSNVKVTAKTRTPETSFALGATFVTFAVSSTSSYASNETVAGSPTVIPEISA